MKPAWHDDVRRVKAAPSGASPGVAAAVKAPASGGVRGARGCGGSPPLVNKGASVTRDRRTGDRKAGAPQRVQRLPGAVVGWTRLQAARPLSSRSTGRSCGYAHGRVAVDVDAGGLRVAGVQACRSALGCPRCAVRMGTVRRQLATDIAERWEAIGGTFWSGVVTISHTAGHDPAKLLDVVQACWRAMWEGSRTTLAARAGVVGSFRAVDATYGDNGYHPHLHFVLFVAPGSSWEDVRQWWRIAGDARRSAAAVLGHDSAPEWNRLQRCRSAGAAASYAAKAVADSTMHGAKDRCIFALLDHASTHDAWRRWEAATTGRRSFAWIGKKRLEALIGPFVDPGDDAQVSEIADRFDNLVQGNEVHPATWHALVKYRMIPALYRRILAGHDLEGLFFMLQQADTEKSLLYAVLRC